MAIDTLDALKAAINDWALRDDLPLDNIISVAESRIWDDLRIREMGCKSITTITEPTTVVETPKRFIDMRRIRLLQGTGGLMLKYTAPDLMPEILGTGLPYQFTVHVDQIEFDATLQADQQLEMLFFRAPWPLGIAVPEDMPEAEIPKYSTDAVTVDTNPVLQTRPNIYLWASLIEVYGREGADAGEWAVRYKEAVDKANESARASQSSGSRRATSTSRGIA